MGNSSEKTNQLSSDSNVIPQIIPHDHGIENQQEEHNEQSKDLLVDIIERYLYNSSKNHAMDRNFWLHLKQGYSRDLTTVDIFSYDSIFVPVEHHGRQMWPAIICMKTRTIYIYHYNPTETNRKAAFQTLCLYLEEESRAKKNISFNFEGWIVQHGTLNYETISISPISSIMDSKGNISQEISALSTSYPVAGSSTDGNIDQRSIASNNKKTNIDETEFMKSLSRYKVLYDTTIYNNKKRGEIKRAYQRLENETGIKESTGRKMWIKIKNGALANDPWNMSLWKMLPDSDKHLQSWREGSKRKAESLVGGQQKKKKENSQYHSLSADESQKQDSISNNVVSSVSSTSEITRDDGIRNELEDSKHTEEMIFFQNLLEILNKRMNKQIHIMNLDFWPRYSKEGYDGVKDLTESEDIFSFENIIVRVKYRAAVISMKERTIYYDPDEMNCEVVQNLRSYLQEESIQRKRGPFNLNGWKTKYENLNFERTISDLFNSSIMDSKDALSDSYSVKALSSSS